jgi:hypothetical protein
MLFGSEAYVELVYGATKCSGAQLPNPSGGGWAWRSAKM